MKLDFIEIGPCDFDTLYSQAGRREQKGIVIEPTLEYYKKIPKNFIKHRFAMSDHNGFETLYFLESSDIKKYKLKECCKGMSSLGLVNPHLLRILKEQGLEGIVKKRKVKTFTISYLIDKYKISEIMLLKIDAEGYDGRIVRSMINDFKCGKIKILPRYVIYESNLLMSEEERELTHTCLIGVGYYLIQRRDGNREYIKL